MSTVDQEAPDEIRDRLCLVLDLDDLVAARRLARELAPWFGSAKVGIELFSAAGPDSISAIRELGYRVFADLKLHDNPNSVNRAARVLGSVGASYLTMHAHGGVAMLKAGVHGLDEGAAAADVDDPIALAVTVLTSDDSAPPHILPKRVKVAMEGGCGGIVCAVGDVAEARQYAPRFTFVTPGIRTADAERHDQRHTATPAEAFAAGSDLIVVGRAVTAADDPMEAARSLVASVLS